MNMQRQWIKSILLSTMLSGCAVGPKYTPPTTDVPCEWQSPISEGMTTDYCENNIDQFNWWESLNDPTLNSLIERAALQNLDMYISASRVCQARRIHAGKQADRLPQLDGSASYNHAYYNQKTLNDILGTKNCEGHQGKKNIDIFEIGFDANWEIDFFGKTTRELSALKADIESAQENVNDAWVSLSAEIGKTYVELRGYQQQLALVTKNITAQQQTVALTTDLVETGLSSTIDLNQTQEQINLLESKQPIIELAINKSIYRLSVLLGHAPNELYEELSTVCTNMPTLPVAKPIGVPSELLRRRPDIRKAERDLAAATERVGSAIAGLFPRFSLRGFIGDISTHLPSLFESGSNTWFGGPQLLLPLFNSRLIQDDIEYNKMKNKEALYQYQKTVLLALEETENAIGTFHAEMKRNANLGNAAYASEESYNLTNDLYENGFKNYFEVLTTQRSHINNEEAYIKSNTDLLIHYISLYKALGGSFISCP